MSDAKGRGLRAVAYVRVSLEREDMISPELQMIAVSDYCKRRGYTIVRTIQDLDLSGRFWKRRQVEQAINMIEHSEADVLVVWRWSRVSRNRLDWAIAVDRVESVGGRLESATEGFDTTTAVGRFARGMLAEFAAFESDRIGDIWREVRERRIRLGLTPMGHEQFGYQKVRGQYVVDKKTGPLLAEVYRRYNAGESFHSLTCFLNRRHVPVPRSKGIDARWAHQTLSRLMDRGFGAGFIVADGEFLRGAHEAVISEAEWAAYQRRRDTTRHPRVVRRETFLLDGLLFCACGRQMTPEGGRPDDKRKYRCTSHGARRRVRSINEDRVNGLLFRWLVRLGREAGHAAAARGDSKRFADTRAREARQLARGITDGADAHTVRTALAAAETGARWRDPVDIARTLVEDWSALHDSVKLAMLLQLAERLVVRTGHETATMTVHTTWQTRSSYTAGSVHAFRCENPRDDQYWLTADEALRLTRVHRRTLREWREGGLLPLTRSGEPGHYLYAYRDLERVLNAPRLGRLGIDRAALKAALTTTVP